MGKAIRVLMVAGMVAGLPFGTAIAQVGLVRMDDFEQCRRAETMAELRLKSCTQVVEDTSRIAEVRADGFLNRGVAKEELGDISGAIADYTEGLKLNPSYRQLYHRRGLAYDEQGKADLAIADFSHAIRLEPKDTEALIYRGLTHAAQGDFDRALMDYDTALAENPDDSIALVIRGEIRETMGRSDTAIADYRRALQLDPQNAEAKEGLARLEAKGANTE